MLMMVTDFGVVFVLVSLILFVLIVVSLTFVDGNSMLASMGVVPAASENRMQQHHGDRQNAGQVTEHRGLCYLRYLVVVGVLRQMSSSARTELCLELEFGQ